MDPVDPFPLLALALVGNVLGILTFIVHDYARSEGHSLEAQCPEKMDDLSFSETLRRPRVRLV